MARKIELLPPFSVQSELEDRITKLMRVLEYKKTRLQSAPPGKLKVCSSRGYAQFYKVDDSQPEKPKIYLAKEQLQLRKSLAQKEYDLALLEALKKDIENYQNALRLLNEVSASLHNDLHPARKTLVQPVTLADSEYASIWLAQEYQKKLFRNTDKTYTSARGYQVRSKSEVIIADTLSRLGVPCRYEFPVVIEGTDSVCSASALSRITVHPDFYCLNLTTRQEFCWEHFGMMDDPEYAEKAVRKINAYAAAGWLPGVNFICTFETQTQPLQSSLVETIAWTYLK